MQITGWKLKIHNQTHDLNDEKGMKERLFS